MLQQQVAGLNFTFNTTAEFDHKVEVVLRERRQNLETLLAKVRKEKKIIKALARLRSGNREVAPMETNQLEPTGRAL